MKKKKIYKLAIRKKSAPEDYFWKHEDYMFTECAIDTKGKYWLADPFVYEKEGVLYIFYEAFDMIKGVGKIGYSIQSAEGTFSSPRIIIDENFHLSFPYIFDYDGDIYIMPESSGDWRLRLYKAKKFPDEWEPAEILLPDAYACDSILIENKTKRWLLTNEMYHHPPVDSYGSCWVKNYLYELDGLKVIGEGVKIAEGDFGMRNAGQSFEKDGKIYRIGQDCRYKQYGRGLALFGVEEISPFKETMIWNKDCNEIAPHIKRNDDSDIIGVHTYNGSANWEIIDYSQIVKIPFILKMRRLCRYIRTIMEPFTNRFI